MIDLLASYFGNLPACNYLEYDTIYQTIITQTGDCPLGYNYHLYVTGPATTM